MAQPYPPSTQIATVFGIGRVPLMPGTLASLAALPIGWWLAVIGGWVTLLAAAFWVTLLGIWACGRHEKFAGKKDPSECVIDEVAGQWIALLPVAFMGRLFDVLVLAATFLLFRVFDILKPWPIYKLQKYSGGLGIMLDDVAAGLAAGVLVLAGIATKLI
jgi:phosphatidylglycerophosphatase A